MNSVSLNRIWHRKKLSSWVDQTKRWVKQAKRRWPRLKGNLTAMKPFATLAIVIFTIVAVLHFLRILIRWEVVIQMDIVAMWPRYDHRLRVGP